MIILLERNEALIVDDLDSAMANSRAALHLAESLQDSELLQAARFDCELISRMNQGKVSDPFFSQIALTSDRETERWDLRVRFHRNYMVAMALIFRYGNASELGIVLDELEQIAQQSQDTRLIARQNCVELFVRCCFANRNLAQPLKTEVRQFMDAMPQDPVWDGQMIALLLKSQQQSIEDGDLERIDALVRSPRNSNTFLKTQLLNAKALCLLQTNQTESSIDAFEEARQFAKKLKSHALNLELERRLLRIKSELGSPGDLLLHQLGILTSPAMQSLSLIQRSDTMKMIGYSVPVELFSWAQGYGLTEDISMEPVKLAKRQNELLADAYHTLRQERRQNEAELQDLENNNRVELESQRAVLARLRTFSLAASIVVLALLPWLFLLLQQSRLNKVKNRLATEYQRAVASEAKVDGLTSRLNRVERMHSLGLMAGGIAHDFNNLLVGIMGNAELIQMMGDRADKDFVRQRVMSIQESAERAADIARNMLAYSGKHPIERRESAINELVTQLESVLVSACLPTQRLVLALGGEELVVSVDRTMAERALLNLVKNASQFSPPHGTITVRTARISVSELQDEASCFGETTHQGDFAMIEVIDFGNGFSEAEREHIFEPFYSTTEQGRGLGLAVVYGFMKSHNGLVQCLSSNDKGTRFQLILPLMENGVPQEFEERRFLAKDRNPLQDFPNGHGKTVLLIDDDFAVLELCKELLELTGWKVIVAKNGRDGIETMQRLRDDIDCVLLDIVMPDMSGGEVLNEMEAQKIPTPVVLTSGFSKIQMEAYFARTNVTAIISKPFHNGEVVSALFHAAVCDEFSKQTRVRVSEKSS